MLKLDSQVLKHDLLLEELNSLLGELDSLLSSPGGLSGRVFSLLISLGRELPVAHLVAKALSGVWV